MRGAGGDSVCGKVCGEDGVLDDDGVDVGGGGDVFDDGEGEVGVGGVSEIEVLEVEANVVYGLLALLLGGGVGGDGKGHFGALMRIGEDGKGMEWSKDELYVVVLLACAHTCTG